MKALIDRGYEVNQRANGLMPLHTAVLLCYLEGVRILLTHSDAKVNAKSSNDETPLQLAERLGFTEIADLLRSYRTR